MNQHTNIDYADIQGLVRFSHARLSESAYLLLTVSDAAAARNWLRQAPITNATKTDPKPDSALQIAISANGMTSLQVEQSIIYQFSDEFNQGMVDGDNRSRRLGDVGDNSPCNWRWGGLEKGEPDVLLMLFTLPGKLDSVLTSIKSDEFMQAFNLDGILNSEQAGGPEPFGFADGISQPKTDWQQQVSTDLHERDRFANLLALGEVILGYRNEYGLYTDRPLLDVNDDSSACALPIAEDEPALRDLGRNGSYLVFRQLGQDVPGFWQYLDLHADSKPEQREYLARAMVGRHRDGAPLIETSQKPINGIALNSKNHFTYEDDPRGNVCPIGSHVRRANPRTGDYPKGVSSFLSRVIRALGFHRNDPQDDLIASTRFHRILRRGRVYGSSLTPEQALTTEDDAVDRGLHFICLGGNISRQFEFVQNAWMMNSKFAGLPTEQDPLLGNRAPLHTGADTAQFTLPQDAGPAKCVAGLPQFVTVKGGGYFFLPGLAALNFMVRDPKSSES